VIALLAGAVLLALTPDVLCIIPTRSLSGGGSLPMMMMGGNDYAGWFQLAGKGAAIQTFWGYHNGPHLAPQLKRIGRQNVFVSSGIPCGGIDGGVEPMNASQAMSYIDTELAQLDTNYVDLLLLHHRCETEAETQKVWGAMEAAKQAGKTKHIGVSNFNAHDMGTLSSVAQEPIEVNEAHFGIGTMDFEALAYMREHSIVPVSFSSLSGGWDHPAIADVAASHQITVQQAMYAYVNNWNISVLSAYDPRHPEYTIQDLKIFNITLSTQEMKALDQVQLGKRTCTDCFTDECEACAGTLLQLGCPMGMPMPVWGRDNKNATQCMECAALAKNKAAVLQACGGTSGGETLETMVPKACGA